jgi:hypothetical protein
LTEHHLDLGEAERSSNDEKLADPILTAYLNVKEGENV